MGEFTHKQGKVPNRLKGKNISWVGTHYESIVFTDGKNTYFIDRYELLKIVRKHNYSVEPKRTRAWLHLIKEGD